MSEINIFKCKVCNKGYKHRQSLYKHVKTKHNTTSNSNLTTLEQQHNIEGTTKLICCKYCNKVFNHNQSKYRHQKKCNQNIINNSNKIYSKTDIEKAKKKLSNILTKKFIELLKELKIGDNICNNISNELNDQKI